MAMLYPDETYTRADGTTLWGRRYQERDIAIEQEEEAKDFAIESLGRTARLNSYAALAVRDQIVDMAGQSWTVMEVSVPNHREGLYVYSLQQGAIPVG